MKASYYEGGYLSRFLNVAKYVTGIIPSELASSECSDNLLTKE